MTIILVSYIDVLVHRSPKYDAVDVRDGRYHEPLHILRNKGHCREEERRGEAKTKEKTMWDAERRVEDLKGKGEGGRATLWENFYLRLLN